MAIAQLVAITLLSCVGCESFDSEIPARLGDKCFAVPTEYAEALDAPPFLPGVVSHLGYTHMRLMFRDSELVNAVPGYEASAETQVVTIAVATSAERWRAHHLGLNYGDEIWGDVGSRTRRTLDPLPNTSWYRLCITNRSCLLISEDPRESAFDPRKSDVLIASCTAYELRMMRMCTVPVVADDRGWILTMHLHEQNVPYRNELANYILGKVDSWEQDC